MKLKDTLLEASDRINGSVGDLLTSMSVYFGLAASILVFGLGGGVFWAALVAFALVVLLPLGLHFFAPQLFKTSGELDDEFQNKRKLRKRKL